MKISDLRAGTGSVNITATVVNKEDPREVRTKYGKELKVANATLKDETGTISISLWENDIDAINVGDKVEISNGYVNEFKGNLQLSTGRNGKITVIGKGDETAESDESTEDMDDSSPAETDDLNPDLGSDETDL
ncbi:replication factor A large subunit [Candidatus Mancarchaeum acidiphilum]|uniref:Replication factor A large subunit n=1 Tax=Candidatus Mancarchaeum acidiphilum TaxID=1920749 RepID=A0A218NPD0_9ARCH|nr:OB-fold nucleic acid binding domain-containing protein [Candidatus Mancarchaeum acidiphilum]ASI14296.1 replication factor A large subunit [Candidatus Mancarchaeum acidiphilum]